MTFTVGGVDVAAVHVGSVDAVAVYAGSQKVWPATTKVWTWTRIENNASPHRGEAKQYDAALVLNSEATSGHDIMFWAGYAGSLTVTIDGTPITRTLTQPIDHSAPFMRLYGFGITGIGSIRIGATIEIVDPV